MAVESQKRVIQIVDEITRCAKSFIHLKQGQKIDVWIVWLGKNVSECFIGAKHVPKKDGPLRH